MTGDGEAMCTCGCGNGVPVWAHIIGSENNDARCASVPSTPMHTLATPIAVSSPGRSVPSGTWALAYGTGSATLASGMADAGGGNGTGSATAAAGITARECGGNGGGVDEGRFGG